MRYAKMEGIEKEISRIFLGTASIPQNTDPNAWLNSIMDTGVNAIDTARFYKNSEATIGEWFERCGRRDDVILLTKCCHPDCGQKRVNAKAMKEDIAKSLEMLRTSYVDILVLHRDDPETEVGEIVDAFNEMKAKGQVKAFGGSNWTHQRIEAANEYAYKHDLMPFTVSSPNYGLANCVENPWGPDCVALSGAGQEEARAWYRRMQMPVIAYSALGRGLFSGRMKSDNTANAEQYIDVFARKGYAYPENYERLRRCEILAAEKDAGVSQVALAWMFHQRMNMFAVISTAKADRMQQNIAALELPLSQQECRWLNLEADER